MRRNFGGHGVAEPLLVSQLTSVGFKMVEEIPDYPPKWPSGSYSVVLQKPAESARDSRRSGTLTDLTLF